MKRRSLILMAMIVLLPFGLLTLLTLRMIEDEQSVMEQRFRSVMIQRLEDINRTLTTRFDETERRLHQITQVDDFATADLREIVRREPQITQLFVLSPAGTLVYPNPGEALNATEISFLQRASRMFTDRDLQSAVARAEALDHGDRATIRDTADSESVVQNPPMLRKTPKSVPGRTQDREAALPQFSPAQTDAESSVDQGTLQRQVSLLEESLRDLGTRSDNNYPSAEYRQLNRRGDSGNGLSFTPGVPPEFSESSFSESQVPKTSAVRRSGEAFTQAEHDRILVPADPGESDVRNNSLMFSPSSGWFVWYWDRGLNLIYWQRRPSGHIVGAALERSRWISELIAWLPETAAPVDSTDDSVIAESHGQGEADSERQHLDPGFRVVSSSAESVYEWGGGIAENAVPFCEVPLAVPLSSWRLQCFVSRDQVTAGTSGSLPAGLLPGLAAFGITLATLAWLLYRDYDRDMREASQQVSFVNQVSHELKTPLTNIRMYAELLEADLAQISDGQSERPQKRLEVILSEAQRLSRLIGNVLTFARQQRRTLQLHPAMVRPGELVRQIAERFGPSLTKNGIHVRLEDHDSSQELGLDVDFVEQILGNLISNVEKYAASGKTMLIRTSVTSGQAVIDVIDQGSGIPTRHHSHIFSPFSRVSKDLCASNGTGIGLSITRELARRHGGDVRLLPAETGCWFQVTLKSAHSS